MKFLIIVRQNGNELIRANAEGGNAAFRMTLAMEDFAECCEDSPTEVFITDKETKTTHVLVFDGSRRYCDGEDKSRFWDSVVDGWVF